MMMWLEHNAGALTAVFSLLLAGITAAYVFLTWRLLQESQKTRAAATRPEIAVYLRPWEGAMSFVILCIENVGAGPAHDVRFTMNYKFREKPDRVPLAEVGPFRRGISYFAPGQKIEHFLASVIGKLEELKRRPLDVVASYKDSAGRDHTRSFVLDFGEWENLSRIGNPPEFDIAKALKDLQKDIHHLTTGFSKPTVLWESVPDHVRRQNSDYLAYRIASLSEAQREELEAEVDRMSSEEEEEEEVEVRDEEVEDEEAVEEAAGNQSDSADRDSAIVAPPRGG